MISKLQKYIALVFVFSIPFQTRIALFSDFSLQFSRENLVLPLNNFYHQVFLYGTDLLLFGLLLLCLLSFVKFSRENSKSHNIYTVFTQVIQRAVQSKIGVILIAFCLFLLVSTAYHLFSRENLPISTQSYGADSEILLLYGLFKLIQGIFLLYLLNFHISRENLQFKAENSAEFSRENVKSKESTDISREKYGFLQLTMKVVYVSAFFQAVLAVWQYLFQRSVGLKILGEEFIRPGIPGIAEFFSREISHPLFYRIFTHLKPIADPVVAIRGYGTFPHPNVLAGFLVVSLLVGLALIYKSRGPAKIWRYFLYLSWPMLFAGLIVSFSRVGWLAFALGLLVLIFAVFATRKRDRENMLSGKLQIQKYFPEQVFKIIAVIFISCLIAITFFGGAISARLFGYENESNSIMVESFETGESLDQRVLFNDISTQMMKDYPVFGTGARQSLTHYRDYAEVEPYQYQPVHNIYFLVGSEYGLLAGILFVVFLFLLIWKLVKQNKQNLESATALSLLVAVLFIGIFDHYWLTIQQGILLFWLVVGLALAVGNQETIVDSL